MNATLIEPPVSKLRQRQSASISAANKAWVAKGAKQPMALETFDLGLLGAEDVEVAVEHCGLCHSDLSSGRGLLADCGAAQPLRIPDRLAGGD